MPDQAGRPALRERHVDRVEVARHDGVLEHGARLVAHVAREVARGEVHQREQADLGGERRLRGLARGAVPRLPRADALVLAERRFVDEHVGAVRVDLDGLDGRGVARVDDPAAVPHRPDDLLGAHAVDGLAVLQAAEVGALGDAERARETQHSTAEQAAKAAQEAEVRLLALVHLSTRYGGREIRDEARAVFSETVVPRYFDAIDVPFPERGAPELVRWDPQRPSAPAEAETQV